MTEIVGDRGPRPRADDRQRLAARSPTRPSPSCRGSPEWPSCTHLDQILVTELPGDDRRLRGVPEDRRPLGAPAHVHDLREDRLLRLVAEPPRARGTRRGRAPDRPLGRAGRGLELVLRRRGRVRRRLMEPLPPLPLEEWEPTKDTLHLWVQIVGKVRMASAAAEEPLVARAALRRRARADDAAPARGGRHRLRDPLRLRRPPSSSWRRASGEPSRFELVDGLSVAEFDEQLHAVLGGLGVDVTILEKPFGVPDDDAVPGRPRARVLRPPRRSTRFWRVLDWSGERARGVRRLVLRQASPVHLFWHALDLARHAVQRPRGAGDAGRRPGRRARRTRTR